MKPIKVVANLMLFSSLLLAACARFAPAPGEESQPEPARSAEKTIYVGPELVDCVGVAPQQCMQVKESPDAAYTLFYGNIEGFTFEPGYEYELIVTETQVENPPADASSIKWTLVEVVSQTPVEPTSPESGVLDGTHWTVATFLNAAGAIVSPLPGTTISAEFLDGQITGNASCNRYFASYTQDGDNLTIGQAGSTMMFCGDPAGVMDQESAYLANLAQVVSFQLQGENLLLLDSDGNPLVIYTQAAAPSLTGVVWDLVSYNNGKGGVVSVLAGTTLTAEFAEDGTLSGSSGCNSYSASYSVDGETIAIEPGISTLMACSGPDGIMEQEAAYLQALPTAATYGFIDGQLELRTADGALVAAYRAQAAPDLGLEGTQWTLDGFVIGGDAFASPLAGTTITASFFDDGRVSGSAGCNSYSAGYEINGELLAIGPAAATKKLCPDPAGVMDQETNYLLNLEKTASYQISGEQLILMDADGLQILVYNRTTAEGEPIDTGAVGEDEALVLLKNAAYPNQLAPDGIAQLSDGEFSAPVAEDAASAISVRLFGEPVFVTLPDGEEAALVTLASNGGGSGTFIELHLVLLQGGAAQPLAAAMLGDRVIVNSVTWEDSQAVVDMVTQGPEDPMCCPTLHVEARFDFLDGTFQDAGVEELGTVPAEVLPLLGVDWQWVQTQTPVELIAPEQPENYTLRFMPDGRYLIKADCNVGSGSYTLQDSSLELGPAMLTMMACPEGSLDSTYLQQLEAARILFLDEAGDLRLDLFADGGTMQFQRGW